MAELPKEQTFGMLGFFSLTKGGCKKGDMGTPRIIADKGLSCLKLVDFSASPQERKATDAIVLKEKMLPELYRQHFIVSESYVVIISLGGVQAPDDMAQVCDVAPEMACRNSYVSQSRFSSWKKTVGSIMGRETGKGIFINVVV
jgi:hypothetical protein